MKKLAVIVLVMFVSCDQIKALADKAKSKIPSGSTSAQPVVAQPAPTQDATPPATNDKPLAKINGQVISDSEVYERVKSRLSKVEAQIFDIKRAGLNDVIEEKLLEAEASKRGISTMDLLKAEVDSKVVDPKEEEIKAFYELVKARFQNQPIEQVRTPIVNQLRATRRNEVYSNFVSDLTKANKVEILMERPRTQVAAKGPFKGKAGAPITIVEFSEFQCPFCKRARPTVDKILDTYKDKVVYHFRDFPLSFHKEAPKASEAAHCAGEQDKYWEMNGKIFENQREIGLDKLKEYAKQLGLDSKKFDTCLDAGKFAPQIDQDIKEGSEAGVSGTPAYFVNGIFISGAQPFENFKAIIDEELQRLGQM